VAEQSTKGNLAYQTKIQESGVKVF